MTGASPGWFEGPVLVAPGAGPYADEARAAARELAAAAGVELRQTTESEVVDEANRGAVGVVVLAHDDAQPKFPERVVRHTRVPVLVVRPSAAGDVLAATDFSDPALPALNAGAMEARRRGRPLLILHASDVLPVAGAPELPMTAGALAALEEVRRQQQERLDATARELEVHHGAPTRTELAEGPPARAIVERARITPTELVVVGTHGRTGLARLALGSTAEEVLHRAPCTVLVVRLRG